MTLVLLLVVVIAALVMYDQHFRAMRKTLDQINEKLGSAKPKEIQ